MRSPISARRGALAALAALLEAYPVCHAFEVVSPENIQGEQHVLVSAVKALALRSTEPFAALLCAVALFFASLYAFQPDAARRLRRAQRVSLWVLGAVFSLMSLLSLSVLRTGDLSLLTANRLTLCRSLLQWAGLCLLYVCALRAACRALSAPVAPRDEAVTNAPCKEAASDKSCNEAVPIALRDAATTIAPQNQAAPNAPCSQATTNAPCSQATPNAPQNQAAPSRAGRLAALLVDRRPLLIPFALILLCYLPYWLWSFPGGVTYDTAVQLEQATGLIPWTMRTAIPSTYLVGLLYRAGLLLGSQRLAIGFLNAACVLLVALAAAYSVSTLRRLGVRRSYRVAVLAFVALAPMFPACAVTTSKDAIFLAAFLVWTCRLLLLVANANVPGAMPSAGARGGDAHPSRRQAGRAKRRGAVCGNAQAGACGNIAQAGACPFSAGSVLALALSCLAVLWTRVNGVLCVGACLLVALLALTRRRPLGLTRARFAKLAGVCLAAPLALTLLMNGVIYPALGVEKNPTGDNVLAPLYQQTATVWQRAPEAMTDAERETLLRLWDEQTLSTARTFVVDDMREHIHTDGGVSTSEYLSIWAAQGARRPDLYLTSYLTLTGGYFDPTCAGGLSFSVDLQRPLINAADLTNAEGARYAGPFRRAYAWLTEEALPFCLTSVSAYSLLGYLALLLIVVFSRRRRELLPLAPCLGILIGVLFAPKFDMRYSLPLMAVLPLLIAWRASVRPSAPAPEALPRD